MRGKQIPARGTRSRASCARKRRPGRGGGDDTTDPAPRGSPRSLSLMPRWLSSSVHTLDTSDRYSSFASSSAPTRSPMAAGPARPAARHFRVPGSHREEAAGPERPLLCRRLRRCASHSHRHATATPGAPDTLARSSPWRPSRRARPAASSPGPGRTWQVGKGVQMVRCLLTDRSAAHVFFPPRKKKRRASLGAQDGCASAQLKQRQMQLYWAVWVCALRIKAQQTRKNNQKLLLHHSCCHRNETIFFFQIQQMRPGLLERLEHASSALWEVISTPEFMLLGTVLGGGL